MVIILYYCLKVIICSGVLFGYYLLALRNNRFHEWNRWYLLATVMLSFILPLLKIQLPFFMNDDQPVIVQGLSFLSASDIYFTKIEHTTSAFTLPVILSILYIGIVLALLTIFIRNLIKIQTLKRLYSAESLKGIQFYNTMEPGTPFSFFKNIFWNSSIALDTEKGQQMLRHELTHVQENHSVDKVAIEFLLAFAWWNPFLHFIRKELSAIHEFIADQKASAGDDNLQYASLLLMKAMGSEQYALGNPFFHSQLKRRLTMLTTINNPKFSYMRRLMALPLAALAIALFSFKYTQEKQAAKQQKNAASLSQENIETPLAVHGYYDDTTKKKKVLTVKEYKGSPIITTTLTDDMKGVVVKTKNGKTYFLDRGQANEELGMKLSDNVWSTLDGTSVESYDENGVPKGNYKIGIYTPGQKLIPVPPVRIFIPNGGDSSQPLVILNGKGISYEKFESLDANTIRNVNVWTGDKATEMYGDKGKNGVVEISTKDAFRDDALYIIDGKNGTKKDFDELQIKASKEHTINLVINVTVLEGWEAASVYGEKGKNGVVVITTNQLAKNEVTFSETAQAKDAQKSPDVTVTGYRINKPELTVAGHKINKPDTIVTEHQTGYNAVFTKVEESASFPGGIDGWRHYLEKSLQYPEAAQKHNTQGAVRVQMTVNADGNVSDVKAINDPGDGLGKEAERVIKKGPKWVPAKQNHQQVAYRFVQTITFQLQ